MNKNLLLKLFFVLTIICIFSCDKSRQPAADEPTEAVVKTTRQSTPVEVITLHRFGHRPLAPFYRITLKKDGSVIYVGSFNVPKVGTYEARVDPNDFIRLEQLIDHCHLFEMHDSFLSAEDSDSVEIGVSRGNLDKLIKHGSASQSPVELWAIETAIDGIIANIIDWKKID